MTRLPIINFDLKDRNIKREYLAETYCVDKLDSDTFQLRYLTIDKYQRKDKESVEKLKRENYHTEYFSWRLKYMNAYL